MSVNGVKTGMVNTRIKSRPTHRAQQQEQLVWEGAADGAIVSFEIESLRVFLVFLPIKIIILDFA